MINWETKQGQDGILEMSSCRKLEMALGIIRAQGEERGQSHSGLSRASWCHREHPAMAEDAAEARQRRGKLSGFSCLPSCSRVWGPTSTCTEKPQSGSPGPCGSQLLVLLRYRAEQRARNKSKPMTGTDSKPQWAAVSGGWEHACLCWHMLARGNITGCSSSLFTVICKPIFKIVCKTPTIFVERNMICTVGSWGQLVPWPWCPRSDPLSLLPPSHWPATLCSCLSLSPSHLSALPGYIVSRS